jgi:hypothetical protein
MAPPLPGDERAGYIGLIVAVAFLLTALTTIVTLTNHKYAAEKPAAAATK